MMYVPQSMLSERVLVGKVYGTVEIEREGVPWSYACITTREHHLCERNEKIRSTISDEHFFGWKECKGQALCILP
jgi:hypothetical protein